MRRLLTVLELLTGAERDVEQPEADQRARAVPDVGHSLVIRGSA